MKKSPKIKKAKKSQKVSAADQPVSPDLVHVMMKVAERLEALEKKMETVIQQTGGRRPEREPHFQNARPQNPQQHERRGDGNSQHQHHDHNHKPQQHSHQNHRERQLYQAVCADCGKDCQVPFRPTGERPIYCKECFGKRRGNSQPQAHRNETQAMAPAVSFSQPSSNIHTLTKPSKQKSSKKSKRH